MKTLLVILFSMAILGATVKKTEAAKPQETPLHGTVKGIDGKPVDLSQYLGKVVMVVNVASECGNTPQYKQLEELYKKYANRGFVVLGFPANEFGGQEPGTDAEILHFCTANYKVTFPMFSKIAAKGPEQAPLYKYLTSKETNPNFAGPIPWNFEKFLIDRNGHVVARINHHTKPDQPDTIAKIEAELAKPAPK